MRLSISCIALNLTFCRFPCLPACRFPSNHVVGILPAQVSLIQLTVNRLLCKDPVEQCEDPLIETKLQEFTRKKWVKLAPSRLKHPLEGFPSIAQSNALPEYQRHR